MNLLEAKTFKDNIKKLPSANLDKIADALHHTIKNLSLDEQQHLRRYSNSSRSLNDSLIQKRNMSPYDEKVHDTIIKYSKPLGEKIHLYSGISEKFHKKIMSNQNKTFLSSAHISMSHDPHIAKGFAIEAGIKNKPIIHIESKPSDKGLHISKIAIEPEEYETIIPSGTVLKHLKTTTHKDRSYEYVIHHMTIHSQE